MRTTVDIDPAVLSAARAKAKAERISLGRAISLLAQAGLQVGATPSTGPSGFPVLTGVPARPVTDELVATYRDDGPTDDVA
jgi:hypothetical protein